MHYLRLGGHYFITAEERCSLRVLVELIALTIAYKNLSHRLVLGILGEVVLACHLGEAIECSSKSKRLDGTAIASR